MHLTSQNSVFRRSRGNNRTVWK